MIEFDFTVNPSFLTYSTRPITVPQLLRPYIEGSTIERLESIRIICPNGTTLRGHIYSGYNNLTYYSQIRVNKGAEIDPLGNYAIGQRLIVKIFENSDYIEIEEE